MGLFMIIQPRSYLDLVLLPTLMFVYLTRPILCGFLQAETGFRKSKIEASLTHDQFEDINETLE